MTHCHRQTTLHTHLDLPPFPLAFPEISFFAVILSRSGALLLLRSGCTLGVRVPLHALACEDVGHDGALCVTQLTTSDWRRHLALRSPLLDGSTLVARRCAHHHPGRGIYIPGERFIAYHLFYLLCTSCGRGFMYQGSVSLLNICSTYVAHHLTFVLLVLCTSCTNEQHWIHHRLMRDGAPELHRSVSYRVW